MKVTRIAKQRSSSALKLEKVEKTHLAISQSQQGDLLVEPPDGGLTTTKHSLGRTHRESGARGLRWGSIGGRDLEGQPSSEVVAAN